MSGATIRLCNGTKGLEFQRETRGKCFCAVRPDPRTVTCYVRGFLVKIVGTLFPNSPIPSAWTRNDFTFAVSFEKE